MHAPLLLALGTRNELDQVVKPTHVNSPQHPVMDAGVIIHLLQPERGEEIVKTEEKHRVRIMNEQNQTFSSNGSAGT